MEEEFITMRDVSYILALFGLLFLGVAVLAWWRIIRKPDETPPTAQNSRRSRSAAMVIVIAFLVCAVAALAAVIGWFQ